MWRPFKTPDECPEFQNDDSFAPCWACGVTFENHRGTDDLDASYDEIKGLMDEGIPFAAIVTAADLLGSL